MATINTYNLFSFNYRKASEGALCIMILKSYTEREGYDGTISDATWTGEGDKPFIGTGIIRIKSPNDNILTVNSINYSFDSKGRCQTEGYGNYKLMLGEITKTLSESGNTSETTQGITRTTDPNTGQVVETSETFSEAQSINVQSLNARDTFAIQALKTLMERMDKDPSTLGNNEMNYYCKQAYQWAANMMTEAGAVRIKLDDETAGVTNEVEVQSLEGNTEKLLNNIVAALEKTDADVTVGGVTRKAERITNPEVNQFLDTFVSHTETPAGGSPVTTKYGLYELIKAIENSGGGGGGTSSGYAPRSALTQTFDATTLNDFLTFNAAGDVGYSTKAAVISAIWAGITANDIWTKIQPLVDARIRQWLEAATITITSPLGTFDATFDITFQDLDVSANFIVNTPTESE